MGLTVCSYHVTYTFQSESTLYSCLNVKELLAQSRLEILSLSDCNLEVLGMCLPYLKRYFRWWSVFFFMAQITQVLLLCRMLVRKDQRWQFNKNTFSKSFLAMNVLGMCLHYEKDILSNISEMFFSLGLRLLIFTAQKMKFPIKDFFSKCDQILDLVTFAEEILNGELHFLCSDRLVFENADLEEIKGYSLTTTSSIQKNFILWKF